MGCEYVVFDSQLYSSQGKSFVEERSTWLVFAFPLMKCFRFLLDNSCLHNTCRHKAHHSLQILVYMIACTYVYMFLLEYISVGMLYLYNIFRNIVAAVMECTCLYTCVLPMTGGVCV